MDSRDDGAPKPENQQADSAEDRFDGFSDGLPIGHTFEGYEIVDVLGVGGFGITYLAIETALEREVAIKEYLPTGVGGRSKSGLTVRPVSQDAEEAYSEGLERFRQEAATLVNFSHPNIVAVHRFFEAYDTAYLVMAYEHGETLSHRVRETGPLDEPEVLSILTPIAEGLLEVHAAGFLHRDVTPSNILIRTDGVPVLIDFGAARQALDDRTGKFTAILTDGYAPAEQYASDTDQGPYTDIYGLGASTYFMMTGQRPAPATERLLSIASDGTDCLAHVADAAGGRYSEVLTDVVHRSLALKNDQRPQAIESWLAPLWQIGVRPPGADSEPVAISTGTRMVGAAEDPDITKVQGIRWPFEEFATHSPNTRTANGEDGSQGEPETQYYIWRNAIVAGFAIFLAIAGWFAYSFLSGAIAPPAEPRASGAGKSALRDPRKMTRAALSEEIRTTSQDLRRASPKRWRAVRNRLIALETEMSRRLYLDDPAAADRQAAEAAAHYKDGQFALAHRAAWAAASLGSPRAMVLLGVLFDEGKGAGKDLARAAYWYRRAAELGSPVAQYNLALVLNTGAGVPPDRRGAYRWALKAATAGHTGAQAMVGMAYEDGTILKRDTATARNWYQRAAAKNHAGALFRLGRLYHKGIGVVPDWNRASDFYRRAAALGHQEAKKVLAQVSRPRQTPGGSTGASGKKPAGPVVIRPPQE